MHVCRAEITLGSLALHEQGVGVESVRIERSTANLTQTATITIPRNTQLRGKPLPEYFTAGDEVRIRLGWDDDVRDEFRGYIREVAPGRPLVVSCEDSAWLLKRGDFKKTYTSATMSQVLADVLAGVDKTGAWPGTVDATEVSLGPLRLMQSPAKILEALGEAYGTRFWFRNHPDAQGNARVALVGGKDFLLQDRRTVDHHFQLTILSHNLKFATAEQQKIQFVAVNMLPSGRSETHRIGESGGATRTLTYYNTPDFAARAEAEAARLRYDGYTGTLTSWGSLYAEPGDIVRLEDYEFPERAGSYYVTATLTEMSVSGGFRRTLTLGPKA